MLKNYVIAVKLPMKNESVVVITREDCVPGIWEPITCTDTKEEADVLADKINKMGGASTYLQALLDNEIISLNNI